ncbi:hypothetical protein [Streptomyces sp. NPDC057429]|uniref:hypothetical protein n=1 Tax=Streptomyces sp. NPDC057429 TaxID=3346130 RepID=UPI00368B084C
METTYAWEPRGEAGERTRMTLRNGAQRLRRTRRPPAITSAMRHAQSKDLARLKALLDQQV